MAQVIKKIYLHWTATSYDWVQVGHYHTVILGNGTVKHLTGYDQSLKHHTARRNNESVAIAISCMGGRGWSDYPPTEIQIENMCKEVAMLAYKLGWTHDDLNICRIMTHAEAAANRDFSVEKAKLVSEWNSPTSTPQIDEYQEQVKKHGLPHENYGPLSWFDGWPGGYAERWDLWQVKPSDREGEGGFLLREMIKKYLSKMSTPELHIKPAPSSSFKNECAIYLESQFLATGYLLTDDRCYVQLSKLAFSLGISVIYNAQFRYVNLTTDKFEPRYLADSPLILGYPVIDIYINRPQDEQGEIISDLQMPVRPFMQGIIIENTTYVLLADFCHELGFNFRFENSDRSLRLSRVSFT